ncbi:MAG: AsmA family protein, partial [Methylotenera sp.]
MKKNKKIVIGILAVISLLILLPFFIPIRSLLNQAEQVATQQLGVPVQIGGGRLSLLPTPRVILKDVVVGKQD